VAVEGQPNVTAIQASVVSVLGANATVTSGDYLVA